jgi:hypothetical protein
MMRFRIRLIKIRHDKIDGYETPPIKIFSGLSLFYEPVTSGSGPRLKVPPGGLVPRIFMS